MAKAKQCALAKTKEVALVEVDGAAQLATKKEALIEIDDGTRAEAEDEAENHRLPRPSYRM